MSPPISAFAKSLTGSAVVEFRRLADAVEARGQTIVDLGIGEPDFHPPEAVRRALVEAANAGYDKYVDPQGVAGLREAIADFERTRHGIDCVAEQVTVTTGSVGALSLASRALLGPGDEVLLMEPCYGPYRNLVRLTGAVPVGVPSSLQDGRFTVDAERLHQAVTSRTRAIIVNTPWNPTGGVLSKSELAAIADLAKEHDLWILADEVYSELVYAPHQHVSIAALDSDTASRTVTLNSASKSFAMTGWRLGYCVSPSSLASVLGKINHLTSRCATSFVQYAAITAYRDALPFVETMRDAYAERRSQIAAGLNALDGFHCAPPAGTFYAFASYPSQWGDSRDIARMLLEKAGVIVTAGSAYGDICRNFLRMSFATDPAQIDEGLERIGALVPFEIDRV
ncbi:MAG: pyridoxal phosphate-dependent aminotransferase [Gammaproteobacteria bacterium]|nr:pyridoxal phosphate-dependent aminotransferase [Gammaproteobacteria bacterium]